MNAFAQALQPVTTQSTGVDMWVIVAIGLALAMVAGFVYLKRRNPSAAATLTSAAGSDLHALGSGILAELGKLRTAVEAHLAVQAAPGGATQAVAAEPATPAAPAGKIGVAGVLQLPVTGDPKADLAAFQAAYFG